MINVNTIDIKHRVSVSQRGNAKGKRQSNKQPEKLQGEFEDAIIDGLFTVSTVRYDNEKWPQGTSDFALSVWPED